MKTTMILTAIIVALGVAGGAAQAQERKVSVSPFHDVNNRAYNPKAGYYDSKGNLTQAGHAVTAKYPNKQAPTYVPHK